ncbi:hypothetical protein DAPPUDRAFT_246429 [Daphnia pulex]|uniref:Uncharacterized protein n=1 Tax=Daphnia pulex TaxID=6669 RepID=E9GQH1_DAPPU|nr:hypothetical protein DAPPUDRAFT_246429 [Daphnia pulex]|eukprot:EFX78338.1 hypothetical protein DAPPUDRAFT_246429 [Daphnia pulex]
MSTFQILTVNYGKWMNKWHLPFDYWKSSSRKEMNASSFGCCCFGVVVVWGSCCLILSPDLVSPKMIGFDSRHMLLQLYPFSIDSPTSNQYWKSPKSVILRATEEEEDGIVVLTFNPLRERLEETTKNRHPAGTIQRLNCLLTESGFRPSSIGFRANELMKAEANDSSQPTKMHAGQKLDQENERHKTSDNFVPLEIDWLPRLKPKSSGSFWTPPMERRILPLPISWHYSHCCCAGGGDVFHPEKGTGSLNLFQSSATTRSHATPMKDYFLKPARGMELAWLLSVLIFDSLSTSLTGVGAVHWQQANNQRGSWVPSINVDWCSYIQDPDYPHSL